AGVEQMRASMRKLRSTRIDLMQVHNLLDARAHLDTLGEWKREGRVRYVGVTHYTAGAHDDVARLIGERPVDFIQINYSAAERDAERRLRFNGGYRRSDGEHERSDAPHRYSKCNEARSTA
ncbi:MAG TPA: aldo/keto reductase, partial [Gammaproteobacteria bacterium]|nr:aldo/keto reductase [Gammaproteobacteria bacterium]